MKDLYYTAPPDYFKTMIKIGVQRILAVADHVFTGPDHPANLFMPTNRLEKEYEEFYGVKLDAFELYKYFGQKCIEDVVIMYFRSHIMLFRQESGDEENLVSEYWIWFHSFYKLFIDRAREEAKRIEEQEAQRRPRFFGRLSRSASRPPAPARNRDQSAPARTQPRRMPEQSPENQFSPTRDFHRRARNQSSPMRSRVSENQTASLPIQEQPNPTPTEQQTPVNENRVDEQPQCPTPKLYQNAVHRDQSNTPADERSRTRNFKNGSRNLNYDFAQPLKIPDSKLKPYPEFIGDRQPAPIVVEKITLGTRFIGNSSSLDSDSGHSTESSPKAHSDSSSDAETLPDVDFCVTEPIFENIQTTIVPLPTIVPPPPTVPPPTTQQLTVPPPPVQTQKVSTNLNVTKATSPEVSQTKVTFADKVQEPPRKSLMASIVSKPSCLSNQVRYRNRSVPPTRSVTPEAASPLPKNGKNRTMGASNGDYTDDEDEETAFP